MIKKLNQLLITFTLVSLGFGQLLRFHFVSFLPSFYLHDLSLFIFISLNLSRLSQLNLKKLDWSIIFFLVILFFTNPNFLLTLRFSTYFLSFILVRHLSLDRLSLKKVANLTLFITLVIGLWQYFFIPDLRILANLGWDDHLNRLTFPYFDPNFTGVVFGLSFFFFWQINQPFLALAFLPPLFLTYSRSAILSWLITLFLSFKLRLRFKLLLLFFVLLILTLLPHRFGEGNNLLRTYSIKSRFHHDWQILHQVIFRPFKGQIINRYHLSFSLNRAGTANNSFLYLWQIGGIFSLFSFLYFLKLLLHQTSHFKLWLLVLIASFFNNVLFYPFILIWLLFLEAIDSKVATSTSTPA